MEGIVNDGFLNDRRLEVTMHPQELRGEAEHNDGRKGWSESLLAPKGDNATRIWC